MNTPRCRDSGVSLDKFYSFKKSPLAPLFQSGVIGGNPTAETVGY